MSNGEHSRSPLAEAMVEQRAEALEWLRSLVCEPSAFDLKSATSAVEAAAEQHAEGHPRAMPRDWAWVRTHAWGTCELLDAVRIPGPPGAPWLSLFERPVRYRKVQVQTAPLPRPGTLFGGHEGSPWLAKVIGTHPRYGLERSFQDAAEVDVSGKAFWGEIGSLYEALDGGERCFFRLTAEGRVPLDRAKVLAAIQRG